MPIEYANASVTSWSVIEAFESKLKLGLAEAEKPNGVVRITSSTESDDGGAYKAEEGLHLVFGDPQPYKLDGAGKHGKRVRRVIQVWVVTVSNRDRAGEARLAGQRHVDLEDLVIDIMDDSPPVGSVYNQKIGIITRWIDGAQEMKRGTKQDKGRYVSLIPFEVIYPQRQRAVREDS